MLRRSHMPRRRGKSVVSSSACAQPRARRDGSAACARGNQQRPREEAGEGRGVADPGGGHWV